jgi:hypothetical protein
MGGYSMRVSTTKVIPEKALQHHVYTLAVTLGYTVMETGKARGKSKCRSCGSLQYATGWQGNTPGLPDIYIHSSRWGKGIALAIELKTTIGKVRDTQLELEKKDNSYICRTMADVIDALTITEQQHGQEQMVTRLKQVKDINGY